MLKLAALQGLLPDIDAAVNAAQASIMLTLEQTAIVTPEHTLTIEVPLVVSPGEHHVTVVIDSAATSAVPVSRRLNLILLRLKTPPEFTYRREELYGDNGH